MGLTKNVIYNTVLTTSNYIFPLIVYPYVSRVLGVANIGLCNFIDGVINYFILISMMGVTIMGNRQIASDKALNKNLDYTFSSVLTLNSLSTLFSLILLFVLTFSIDTLYENKHLMFYGALKLVSNLFLIEWFYRGLEDFRYITVRTMIVKCLYVGAIFIFIHVSSDYPKYYLFTVLMVTVNATINLIHSRNYVKFSFKHIDFSPIIKSFLILGAYMLITSFCNTFNTVYLGFATNDTEVGYFTTATKIYSVIMALFSGITVVMLPRMSNLISSEKQVEFKALLKKTTNLLFSFSIPAIFFTVIFSPQIVMLISGPGYQGAIIPMRIVMFLMLIIGYEQISIIQCLMPLKKDKIIMIMAACGAFVSITLNISLVSKYGCIGSAIALLSAETTILLLSQLAMSKYIKVKFPIKELSKNILYNFPLLGILLFLYFILHLEYWIVIIVSGTICGAYTFLLQIFIFKNPLLMKFIKKIAN